jgi:hypothetical protein
MVQGRKEEISDQYSGFIETILVRRKENNSQVLSADR